MTSQSFERRLWSPSMHHKHGQYNNLSSVHHKQQPMLFVMNSNPSLSAFYTIGYVWFGEQWLTAPWYSGGMPDLLLWNVSTCKAKLSEVKGPRDRLSEQQRAWINALTDAEVDVEVLKVIEPRVGKAPKRRRKWWYAIGVLSWHLGAEIFVHTHPGVLQKSCRCGTLMFSICWLVCKYLVTTTVASLSGPSQSPSPRWWMCDRAPADHESLLSVLANESRSCRTELWAVKSKLWGRFLVSQNLSCQCWACSMLVGLPTWYCWQCTSDSECPKDAQLVSRVLSTALCTVLLLLLIKHVNDLLQQQHQSAKCVCTARRATAQ